MEQSLEHRVLAALRAHPGSSPAELRVLSRAGLASVMAALDKLERDGRAFRAWSGRRSFAFLGGAPSEPERSQLAVLASAGTRAVAAALAELGRADVEALAAKTALKPRTVYTHVEALVGRELAAVARGAGTSRVLLATGSLRRCLERFRREPPETPQPS